VLDLEAPYGRDGGCSAAPGRGALRVSGHDRVEIRPLRPAAGEAAVGGGESRQERGRRGGFGFSVLGFSVYLRRGHGDQQRLNARLEQPHARAPRGGRCGELVQLAGRLRRVRLVRGEGRGVSD